MKYGVILQPGESIQKVIRRSLVSLLPTIVASLILILAALVLNFYVHGNPNQQTTITVLALTLVGLALVIFLAGVYVFSDNVLIFTNLHLIEVEQNGLFSRVISQVSFNREQDISGKRSGFFATIFNYGSITVQSAGENVHFIFRYAPNPEKVADEAVATNLASMNNGGQGLGAQP